MSKPKEIIIKINNMKQQVMLIRSAENTAKKGYLVPVLLCLCFIIVHFAPITAYADFGNFAGNSDYGGGSSSGGGFDGDFDLAMEVLTWIIAIIAVLVLMIYYLIKDKVTGGKVFGDKAKNKTSDGMELRTMAEFKIIDAGFDEAAFREQISNLYVQLQQFWHEKDIEPIRPYLTDALFNQSMRQMEDLCQKGQTPFIDRIAVLAVTPRGFYQSGGMDHIVVKVSTRIVSYTLDDSTGNVISGDRNREKFMEYEWDLCREMGIITNQTDGLHSVICPKCGAPLNINQSAKCSYCGSIITMKNRNWALNNIKGLSQESW